MVRLSGAEPPDLVQRALDLLFFNSDDFVEELEDSYNEHLDDMSDVGEKMVKRFWQAATEAADKHKFERELDEKYGVLKDVILHPTVQWLLAVWTRFYANFRVFGDPPLGLVGGIVILVMVVRANKGFLLTAMIGCALFAVNPLVVLTVVALYRLVLGRRYRPKGLQPFDPLEPPEDKERGSHDPLEDHFSVAKLQKGEEEEAYYDHVVLGSNMAGLYLAGLLARCGKRCLVLESKALVGGGGVIKVGGEVSASSSSGSGSVSRQEGGEEDGSGWEARENPEARPWEFETSSPTVGRVDECHRLLKAVRDPSLPETKWFKVGGVDSTSCVHDMVEVGGSRKEVLLPGSSNGLVEQLVMLCPDDRQKVEGIVHSLATVTEDSSVFFRGRAFTSKAVESLKAAPALFGTSFAKLCRKATGDVLQVVCGSPEMYGIMSALFGVENLPVEGISFGAFVHEIVRKWNGVHYPGGGLRGLAEGILPTIQAAGGRILTRTPKTTVLIEEGQAVGVRIHTSSSSSSSGGGVVVRVRPEGSVVSALGALETFTDGLEAKDLEQLKMPPGFRNLSQARPRIHVCVGLRGNWTDDLDMTACDISHVRDNCSASTDDFGAGPDSEWWRISTSTSKDPTRWWEKRTTCVITSEIGKNSLKPVLLPGGPNPEGELVVGKEAGKEGAAAAAAAGGGGGGGGGAAAPAAAAAAAGGGGGGDTPKRQYVLGPLGWEDTRKGRDKLIAELTQKLKKHFPNTEGTDEVLHVVQEEGRCRLASTPSRFACPGLRHPSHIPGLFLAGQDVTTEGLEGQLTAGLWGAHAVLGYTTLDVLLLQRDLVRELEGVRRRR